MDGQPPHYLRQWREFRNMTLRELAKEVGTTPSTISDLETFKLQLSPKWLRRFAPVLHCQQGWMIDQNPKDFEPDLLEIWSRIDPKDKDQALRVMASFIRGQS